MKHIEVTAETVPEYSFSVSVWVHRTLWSVCLYRPLNWRRRAWRRYRYAWLLTMGPFTFRYNRTFGRWYRLSFRRFHTTAYNLITVPERTP